MIVLITTFTLSLLSILILLAAKVRAMKGGRDILSPFLDQRIEYHAREFFMVLSRIYRKVRIDRRRVLIVLYIVLHLALRLIEGLQGLLRGRLQRILNMIKGRGTVAKKGPVSVYLRDVSEYKRQS